MNNFIKSQMLLWIYSALSCFSLFYTTGGISTNETTFDELCRFEGMCLNCEGGGCEDMCHFYDNNCCVNSTSTNFELKKWQYSCVRKFPDMYDLHLDCRGSFNGVYGVYMITKCTEIWKDDHIKAKCEESSEDDLLSKIPVYDIMREVITYKNMYCAFCNMVSLQNIRFWKFDLMCNIEVPINDNGYDIESFDKDCFIRLMYRQHRMCAVNVIEGCNANVSINSLLRDRCENGLQQHVYVWKTERMFNVYKNEFCAQCNYEAGEELQCWAFQAFTCWPQNLPPYKSVQAKINLDLNGYTSTDSKRLYNSTCGEGVIYDLFSQSCLNITCLPSLNRCVSGKCRLVELSPSKFVIQNDSNLFVFVIDDLIKDGRYFVTDSNVHVCLDDGQYTEFELKQETILQTTETTNISHSMETSIVTSSMSSDTPRGKMALSVLVLNFLVTIVTFKHTFID